jgi:hypothetical protein
LSAGPTPIVEEPGDILGDPSNRLAPLGERCGELARQRRGDPADPLARLVEVGQRECTRLEQTEHKPIDERTAWLHQI